MDTVIKEFNNRLHDLDRQRTRALATQQWHKVIALEARIEEVGTWRKFALGKVESEHGLQIVKDVTASVLPGLIKKDGLS